MFKDGEAALMVAHTRWNDGIWSREVTINKVHKSGRLTLVGSRDQWALRRCGFNGLDHFVRSNGPSQELHKKTPELVALIAEMSQNSSDLAKLNKVGRKLDRLRGAKTGAEFWAMLPDEIKELANET